MFLVKVRPDGFYGDAAEVAALATVDGLILESTWRHHRPANFHHFVDLVFLLLLLLDFVFVVHESRGVHGIFLNRFSRLVQVFRLIRVLRLIEISGFKLDRQVRMIDVRMGLELGSMQRRVSTVRASQDLLVSSDVRLKTRHTLPSVAAQIARVPRVFLDRCLFRDDAVFACPKFVRQFGHGVGVDDDGFGLAGMFGVDMLQEQILGSAATVAVRAQVRIASQVRESHVSLEAGHGFAILLAVFADEILRSFPCKQILEQLLLLTFHLIRTALTSFWLLRVSFSRFLLDIQRFDI